MSEKEKMNEEKDKVLEGKWEELEDVLFDEDEDKELILHNDWYIFKRGTSRDDIWHYFDIEHSKGIYYLLYEYESTTIGINNNTVKFEFNNSFTFNKIKETPIKKLEYNKSHDLASIYNESYSVSAYLGVYDRKYTLTYSVHDKEDFNNNLENICEEIVDFNKINTQQELEIFMKESLDIFIEIHKDIINKVAYDLLNKTVSEEFEDDM